jgi:hypothetical protein
MSLVYAILSLATLLALVVLGGLAARALLGPRAEADDDAAIW